MSHQPQVLVEQLFDTDSSYFSIQYYHFSFLSTNQPLHHLPLLHIPFLYMPLDIFLYIFPQANYRLVPRRLRPLPLQQHHQREMRDLQLERASQHQGGFHHQQQYQPLLQLLYWLYQLLKFCPLQRR